MKSQEENRAANEAQSAEEGIAEEIDVVDAEVVDAEVVDAEVVDAEVVDASGLDEEIVVDATSVDDPVDPEIEADEGEAEDEAATLRATISQLETELSAAQAESASNLDQMKRVAAEFQNSKRRQEKQLADAIDRAGDQVVRSLLPVLDGFDLAFQNMPNNLGEEDMAWVNGFRQIQKSLLDLLASQGVEAVPSDGEFDPAVHEAISSEPSEAVESGHIIETLRVGYLHKGQTLRPALVRVAM